MNQAVAELIETREDVWSEALWQRFLEDYWEQKPTRLPMLPNGPFMSLEELFQEVVDSQGRERVAGDRFWVAKRSTPRHRQRDFMQVCLELMGPQPADRDFDGFFSRLGGRTAGINLHQLQTRNAVVWKRLATLVDRIEAVAGSSIIRWDLDTFFGTYRVTPFGVHRDAASVFSFCLQGQRTYCTWPPDYYWPQEALFTPDPDVIAVHLEHAETFVVEAGDLFYWPSNRWHLVLTDGAPSVVVQASAYLRP